MLDQILQADRVLFIYLNGLGAAQYDDFWQLITNKLAWLPFFAVIFYALVKQLGYKQLIFVIVVLALLITWTDQTTNFFKDYFQRLRPSSDPSLQGIIRAVEVRSSYSFFSAHASNSMAAATFLFLILRSSYKVVIFIFLWPMLFAYSRIYLGLHYPLDVFCGYCWGICWAFVAYWIYRRKTYRAT